MFDVFYSGTKPNLFAHEQAATSIEEAQRLSKTRFFWWITYLCDYTGFDFLWEPVPWQAHQRHAWRSQWQPDSGTYLVPKNGYTETNYYVDQQLTRLPQYEGWVLPDNIDINSVDYSWHPNPVDPPYIYHFPSRWQQACGLTYTVTGAVDIKLTDPFIAQALSCEDNWHIPVHIRKDSIDFSWHPNTLEPPMIYHFATKHHWDRVGGPEYRIPGAVEIKYIDDIVADTQSDLANWYIPDWIDATSIDYSWVPNPTEEPYIYEFAVEWGWNNIGGPEYRVPGATSRKYVDYFVARTQPDPDKFKINADISPLDDVLRWRPNPTELPYIYVFGNQWYLAEIMPTVEYHVPGATERKYIDDLRATLLPNKSLFSQHYTCNFDFSWTPDPGDPPYIYVFGNQWYPAEIMPTVEYAVEGAVERKFMEYPLAQLPDAHSTNWSTLVECEWDYSWVPDPGDPPYIYVFGNQWHPAVIMPTVRYTVEGATEVKFMDYPVAKLLQDTVFWTVPDEVDSANIDYSWVPDPGSPPYIYHFGTDYQASVGLTYAMPGATELKFAGEIPRIQKEKAIIQVQDIFYLDRSNAMSAQRFAQLQERYPHIQKVRYVNSAMDTIRRCVSKTKQNRFWVISSLNDYSEFDFAWHAQPWQNSMTHVFGTQWNKWSDTFLVNRWEFERCAKWAKGIEEFPNLNFVSDQQVHSPSDAHDIYVINFGNKHATEVVDNLKNRYRVVKQARYFDNYLDTIKRVLDGVEAEHIWIVSSICDYSHFDFSWQPEAWQSDMLHVFPSFDQKFGDTFFVPVQKLREKINELELLDWFETVNYCDDQCVSRWPMPIVKHNNDSHVETVLQHTWTDPLTMFTVDDGPVVRPTVSLWREKSKTIIPLSSGASAVIVPQSAVPYIKNQLYDYPYIDKTQKDLMKDQLLDIVFISNGESMAEENWQYLNHSTSSRNHRVVRVDGVNGRVAAYHAAANASNTPWFFAVFAKLQVVSTFDWTWQPDRMQEPKHYIFHAGNPVNGLEYGHQAMIAYNKKLVLANTGHGLDFTLDSAHEVVPILSGHAMYCEDPWTCWRTAFREALKLRASLPNVENEYRLKVWLKEDSGTIANGHWSHKGAQDAMDFYDSVNGNFEELRKSYDWEWLSSYAFFKRNLSTGQ